MERNIKYLLIFSLVIISQNILFAEKYNENSNCYTKIGIVLQTRFEAIVMANDSNEIIPNWQNRRVRLVASGNLGDRKIKYCLQLGFSTSDLKSVKGIDGSANIPVYDAFIDWEIASLTNLRIGQFKLPASLSRLMSFRDLNFFERSKAENLFKVYRDIGVMINHSIMLNKFVLNAFFALTHGEGVNSATLNNLGLAYTGRLEFLPLGNFSDKSYLCEMDKVEENVPKLLIGVAYSRNNKAQREYGTTGEKLDGARNINSYFFDILMKYQGLSIFGEYLARASDNAIINNDAEQYIYIGDGYSIQSSYKVADNNFVAVRYCNYEADKAIRTFTNIQKEENISISYSRYLFDEKLKFQFEVNYVNQKNIFDEKIDFYKVGLQLVLAN